MHFIIEMEQRRATQNSDSAAETFRQDSLLRLIMIEVSASHQATSAELPSMTFGRELVECFDLSSLKEQVVEESIKEPSRRQTRKSAHRLFIRNWRLIAREVVGVVSLFSSSGDAFFGCFMDSGVACHETREDQSRETNVEVDDLTDLRFEKLT